MDTSNTVRPRSEAVACIVPAYNEERYLANVLDVLCQVPDLVQITVVDDVSEDNTSGVVRSYCERDARVRLLRLPANRGKGGAVVAGAEASNSDLIALLDADLIGLRPEHVLALIKPLQTGACSMTLGLFTGGRFWTDWSHRLTPFLSGQRCLRWSLFRSTPALATSRWGVEVALSLHAWYNGYDVMAVPWDGVTHVMKCEKVGLLRGGWSYLHMYGQIAKYVMSHLPGDVTLSSLTKGGWTRE